MLSVTVIAVGKLKERYLTDACAEYSKRLGAFCKLTILEVDEYRLPDSPSPAQIELGLQEEGKRISGKIPTGSQLITLCIEGKLLSSEGLAGQIAQWANQGASSLCFIIGGSHGLWQPLKEQSKLRLSISPMTFPHQLARVLLLEQIYRCMTINAHHKYHK